MDHPIKSPEKTVVCTAINLKTMQAVSNIGMGAIRTLLDSDFEPTEHMEFAVHCTIEWEVGGWSVATLSEYTSQPN